MSGEYVPTTEDARWLHIRDKFVDAFDSEDWEEAYKSADEWLTAHDARVASEAAEKALRDAESDLSGVDHPDLTVVVGDPDDDGTWESIPVTDWLRARADRIAAERKEGTWHSLS